MAFQKEFGKFFNKYFRISKNNDIFAHKFKIIIYGKKEF